MARLKRFAVRLALAALCAMIPVLFYDTATWQTPRAVAQTPPADSEQSDFDAAKALGTAEAWHAFLSHYSSGFHADLARAYLKKLEGGTPAAQPQPTAPVTPPQAPPPDVVSASVSDVKGVVGAVYDGGAFRMNGNSAWKEIRSNGIAIDYSEIRRTEDGIELQPVSDPSVFITLDVQGRAVLRRAGSQPAKVMHEIRNIERNSEPINGARATEEAAYANVCQGQEGLRARESITRSNLRFINATGTSVVVKFIDTTGVRREYVTLAPGVEIVADTFVTHPWVVTDTNGRCRDIFLPAPGASVARLLPKPADARDDDDKSAVRRDPPPVKCGQDYRKVNGKCVLIQNCGANAYRSPEGDCYCTKGFKMVNGKCTWKTDKKGFEVKPWQKPGCKTWKVQCANGNNGACGNYEANCQVN